MPPKQYNPTQLQCQHCPRVFRNLSGLSKHHNTSHARPHGHVLPIHPENPPGDDPSIQEADNDGYHGEPADRLDPEKLYYEFHPLLNGA